MAQVLDAAASMLEQLGPERTSIPALAEAAGVPRASIYPFFPDKHALFSHLANDHMQALSQALASLERGRVRSWRAWVKATIDAAAGYYNAHRVAGILLLQGSYGDGETHANKNEAIGRLLRMQLEHLGQLPTLPVSPDAATIAVEIAFACMRHGYAVDGRISEAICKESNRAVAAYLSHWDPAS